MEQWRHSSGDEFCGGGDGSEEVRRQDGLAAEGTERERLTSDDSARVNSAGVAVVNNRLHYQYTPTRSPEGTTAYISLVGKR